MKPPPPPPNIKRAKLTTLFKQGTNALNIVLKGNFALSSRLNIGSNKSVCIIFEHLVSNEPVTKNLVAHRSFIRGSYYKEWHHNQGQQ
jgi:hypothetical protein